MVAEYQPDKVSPQTGRYYYCTTDQINPAGVVTDDLGNVVYAAAHKPCVWIQQTKEDIQQNLDDSLNSEPKINVLNSDIEPPVNGRSDLSSIKFSGKEQDTESGLYYFGARYYDPTLYRFLSPNPVIPTDRAAYNPQRWNLYGYCLSNPMNYMDRGGKYSKYVHFDITLGLCLKVGLPIEIALRIAKADQRVDDNWKTTSWNLISGFYLHFPNVLQLENALDIALSTYDPEILGMALHTIQDFYSHTLNGYNLSTGGHFLATAFGLDDPDDPWADLERLSAVVEATEMILENYKKRLTDLLINITSTILDFVRIIYFI